MAMLKLKPACKNYVWGGRRLIEEYGFDCAEKICAEAWTLSAHPDGASTIEGGSTLTEYIKRNGKEILGTNSRRFKDFPVLIKFIDARENLSVQVHPPDDYALAHENQLGKSEMWYIIDAEENARVYCGFNAEISKAEFIRRIKDNSLSDVLNVIWVKRGDVIFIPAGTIHAVCRGVLLAEIQQNSNVSYRVYDYGRGRPLHIDKALDVTNLNPPIEHDSYPHVAACDFFVVDKLNLDGEILSEARGFVDEKSFLSVLILNGAGKIFNDGEEISYKKGDSILLTANSGAWKICGTCDALLTTIPDNE